MDLKGEYRIPAPRQTVWEALNDPEILKACIPGCESLEKAEDGSLTATVVSKIGPVKAKFNGTVTLENLNPPESYSIVGEGKGGVAGFAKGGADVSLAEEGDQTVLTYEAKAQVGGKLAQLGSRLIDSTAKKMADQFFSAFSDTVGGGAAETEAPEEAPESEAAPAPAEETPAAPSSEPQPAAAPETKAESKPASAPAPVNEQTGQGLSFSGPMLWVLIGAAALVLILAVAL